MGAPLRGGEVMRSGLDDLVTFNHWLCLTRLRAAGAVMLFTLGLAWLRVGNISTPYAFAVCAGLFAVSGIGLSWPSLARASRLFFYLQSLADLAAITVGIGISVHGLEALLFRSVYALVIVPASLISVPSGLVMAAAATIGHEMLLVHERGFVPGTLYGVESLMPPFLFFLLAQQCFFYGAHLKRKNTALATLADRLEESHQRLGAEARTSAALLDVARTLSSTLEAPELLARVNSTTRQQLGADWSATFLVDAERGAFRLVAVTAGERHEVRVRGRRLARAPLAAQRHARLPRDDARRGVRSDHRRAKARAQAHAGAVARAPRDDHRAPRHEPPRGRPPAAAARAPLRGAAARGGLPAAPRGLAASGGAAPPRAGARSARDRDRRRKAEDRGAEPPAQRLQVHRARPRDARRRPHARGRSRHHGRRHRLRHPIRRDPLHLRHVPSGAGLGRRRRRARAPPREPPRPRARRQGERRQRGRQGDVLHGHPAARRRLRAAPEPTLAGAARPVGGRGVGTRARRARR